MDKKKLFAYDIEIAAQCRYAIIHAKDIDRYTHREDLHELSFSAFNEENDRFWSAIQGLLIASANLSKLFWPNTKDKRNKRTEADATVLRERCQVDRTSAFYDKNMRNHFEHFDERIENYIQPNLGYADTCIIEPGEMVIEGNNAGANRIVFMRTFCPSALSVTFQDEICPLKPLVDAIIALHQRCIAITDERMTSVLHTNQ